MSASLLQKVSARGKLGVKLVNVTLAIEPGCLAIVGAPHDGTGLLFDVIAERLDPAKVARVTLDAPLPEALRVAEVCALSASLRGSSPDPLPPLNLETFARRRVGSLSVDERRAVTLAIALASSAELILIEEPLALLAPVAPRVVVDAIRERAKTGAVIATTSSPRDATRVGDRIAVLLDGVLTPMEESNAVSEGAGELRVIVAASQGKEGAASLIATLGQDAAVARINSAAFATGRGTALVVHGPNLAALAKAVTRAVATSKVDIDVVEPSIMPLDAIRAAIREQLAGARA